MAACTFRDCPVFYETILYAGQEVAAVAATEEGLAAEAAHLIKVEYETLPFVLDPEEVVSRHPPLVGTWPDQNMTQTSSLKRGDAAAGFRASDVTVEGTLGWTNYFQHGSLEPCTAVASWMGEHLYIWTCSQNPFSQQAAVARFLNLSQNRVHLVSHGTGGGHGDKHSSEWIVIAAVLAKKAGQAVQVALNRAENFITRTHQFPVKGTVKVGATAAGALQAIETKFYADLGANGWIIADGVNDPARFTYRCPHGTFQTWSVVTNKPHVGYWRCVAHPQGTFVTEAVMDMLAEKLSINPLDFRLQNILSPGAVDQDSGKPNASNGLQEMLLKLAEATHWREKWHKAGELRLADGRWHGLGLSVHMESHGALANPVGAIVNMTGDGQALILAGISRAGAGTLTALAVIVAETLGLNSEDVAIGDWGNTAVCADGGFQGGSSRTITLGAAFQSAAEDARRQLFQAASVMIGVKETELAAAGGKIFVKSDPSRSRTHAEVLSRAPNPIIGRGLTWPQQLRQDVAGFAAGTPCEVRGASGAAVELAVDPETGEVEILNFVSTVDAGRAIFWQGCLDQIDGGMEIMLGEALLYEQVLDLATGVTLNTDYVNNYWPTTLDLHSERQHPIIIESNDACGPYGCKGMGEPPVSSYGAIINAIYNATGKWLREPPVTPRKILQALGKV
jgi:CO/xanthine dehydrogenase Mo-binding subunit